MRRIFLPVMLVCLLYGCSEKTTSGNYEPAKEETGLLIKAGIDLGVELMTRATPVAISDLSGYRLLIDGQKVDLPADGKITGLLVGEYTVTLTNDYEDHDLYTPAFNDPRYKAEVVVVVEENKLTPVEFNLTQANVGVYFVYDRESLEEYGLEEIRGSVYHGDGIYLEYADNPEDTGYFAPRKFFVRFIDEDGVILDFFDEDMELIEPQPGQVWEVSVAAGPATAGKAALETRVSNIKSKL